MAVDDCLRQVVCEERGEEERALSVTAKRLEHLEGRGASGLAPSHVPKMTHHHGEIVSVRSSQAWLMQPLGRPGQVRVDLSREPTPSLNSRGGQARTQQQRPAICDLSGSLTLLVCKE